MVWPMRQSVASEKHAKWTQKQNGFPQVSLLYLSFLPEVACVVVMGTDLSKRNQWVKNKSENNDSKLDLPQRPTSLEHDSILLRGMREEMKGPPQRESAWPNSFYYARLHSSLLLPS